MQTLTRMGFQLISTAVMLTVFTQSSEKDLLPWFSANYVRAPIY
jgi:hypothetical protein